MEGKEMEKREEDVSQSEAATSTPRGGHVDHTGPEGCSGRGSHGLHTWWAMHGLWPCLPLARSLTFFSRILGIRTPILNPFLDYKP